MFIGQKKTDVGATKPGDSPSAILRAAKCDRLVVMTEDIVLQLERKVKESKGTRHRDAAMLTSVRSRSKIQYEGWHDSRLWAGRRRVDDKGTK